MRQISFVGHNYTYLFTNNCALQCVLKKQQKPKEHNNEAKDMLLNVLHILYTTNKRKINEKNIEFIFTSSTSSKKQTTYKYKFKNIFNTDFTKKNCVTELIWQTI